MKSSLFSALKSVLGTKPKDDAGRSAHAGAVGNVPFPQLPPYVPTTNYATYPAPPAATAPMYAPPFSMPGFLRAPAPAMPPASSPAASAIGLTAGGGPLTTGGA